MNAAVLYSDRLVWWGCVSTSNGREGARGVSISGLWSRSLSVTPGGVAYASSSSCGTRKLAGSRSECSSGATINSLTLKPNYW